MGFVSDYVSFASEVTDAPPLFHRYTALALLGTAVGNRVHFTFGYGRLMPNLWIVLIGESTFTHKSESMNIGKGILSRAAKHLVYPPRFSIEAFYTVLSQQPYGCLFIDEFGAFLGRMSGKNYMEGAKEEFCDLFDIRGNFYRKLQGSEINVEWPRISMVACTTPEWFVHRLKQEDVSAGFLPRFFPVLGRIEDKERDDPLPPAYDREQENNLIHQLRKISELSCIASFSSEAKVIHDGWYGQFRNMRLAGLEGNLTRRFQEYLIKFSMLHEVSETGTCRVISADSVMKAIETVGLAFERIRELTAGMAFSAGRRNANMILRYLQKHGESAAAGEIMRGTGLTKNQTQPALETLLIEERIKRGKREGEGPGRRGEIFSLNVDFEVFD